MNKCFGFSGFMLIAAGIFMLGACLLPHSGSINGRLVIGAAVVAAGVVLQVYIIKKDSRY